MPAHRRGRERRPYLEWQRIRETEVAGVADEVERRRREAVSGGYEPTRPARLREDPPPLPPHRADDGEGFGNADEDGLRMLAALETLTSLEPDYTDDLNAEASVTIIESAGYDVVAEALARDADEGRSLRSLLQSRDEAPRLLLNGYESFNGAGEEATVEIVEAPHAFDAPEVPGKLHRLNPTSLAERIAVATGRGAVGSRFFKALSGD
jgi:hypothetical protein